uniref:Peptide methionine sulfoxide reductase MsrA n=1 Tax=uncultured Thiotrichaceae bacterium TaxID=298394 RepID=A0A6S6S761_9GAMM|nr:MAG: Peptide methionine sulfoxide reductase MsrA (EC [uncultured Thiotrichaceae bacterium]
MRKSIKKSIACSLLTSAVLLAAALPAQAKTDTLIVAGGCFWCVEHDFEKLEGVSDAVSGYINGTTENPTYKEVSSKDTGHFEAVKITYDDEKVTLEQLLNYFWYTIDPTDPDGQFCDKGGPYKTALFYQNQMQEEAFNKSLTKIKAEKPFDAPIVTEILAAEKFYIAEDYHQNYAVVNPIRYGYYRGSCGRDDTIKSLWGKVISKGH